MCEIYLMIEKEFDMEMSEDACESFTTVNDIVEHVARCFYSKWYIDYFISKEYFYLKLTQY